MAFRDSVFHALQGHKIVAGGNAPGKWGLRLPTLKGVALLWAAGGAIGVNPPGFDPSRVAPYLGARFPGALPPATV